MLFGKKNQGTAQPITMAETIDKPVDKLVQPSKAAIIETVHVASEEITTHRQKLAQITKRFDLAYPSLKLIDELKENDFMWFVNGDKFVKRFKYAACVCTNYENRGGSNYNCVIDDNFDRPWYVGDIPDFALNRIAKAKDIGLEFFTIHSNQPLPTKFIISDPVIVGWRYDPRITLSKEKRIWETQESAIGVVVALWNDEGEPEDL
jgi:hypothetical protein